MSILRKLARKMRQWYRMSTASQRALPDFMIIGTQKGGTSSMLHYLSQHPQLGQSYSKEPHYFDDHYGKGLTWYQAQFPIKKKGLQYGEATPYYLFFPFTAERVKQDFPNMKLIVLLRNPVDRAFSHFQMEKKKGKEQIADFESAIDQESTRVEKEWEQQLANPKLSSFVLKTFTYRKRGEYAEQLERWDQHFDENQMLILSSESFFEDPLKSLKRVYEFLEVEYFEPNDLKPRLQGKYTKKMADSTKQKLESHFKSHNQKLWKRLGEQFPW